MSSRRKGLLTYPMLCVVGKSEVSGLQPASDGGQGSSSSSSLQPRRWVRSPEELCVAGMFRHSSLLTEFVATYRSDDPNWRDLLQLDCGNPLSLELRARHCNAALRHMVQKGHALYLIFLSQHTVLHPRGLIEQSHVTCSYGIRGERLRTSIIHEGPLRKDDPSGPRGVLGISQVEGYGTWFQRKPMLWQRSRRIGALQATMGAYDWVLQAPENVGRDRDVDVMLLEGKHDRVVGGGCEVTGIISSESIAQHPYLYVGEFDAPVLCALEAANQAAHKVALQNQLVHPRGSPEHPRERLVALSWTTRTPPPYVPLECDLPFQLQMSKPQVFTRREDYPSTVVGSPFHDAAPVFLVEYNLRQGAEHYLYDESPASRPVKWWSQQANVPYNGMMYCVREGNIDKLTLREQVDNPFDRKSSSSGGTKPRRVPLHATVRPNERAARRASRYSAAATRNRQKGD